MSTQKQLIRKTLGGKKNIMQFVADKMKKFASSKRDMRSLYELMFSEENNILWESTDGYRVRQTTYGQAQRDVERKAARLTRALDGEPHGAPVGLYLENSLDWIEYFWAILRAGYKPVLMNMRLPCAVLDGIVKDYGVCAVVTETTSFATKNLFLSDLSDLSEADGALPDKDVFENEIYLMSSNTSGNLKICCYTGEEFYFQIKDSADIIKSSKSIKKHYKGNLKLLTFLPFYHIFGLVAVYIWFCFFSRTLVYLKDVNPKTILNTVKKHAVTHIFAVPLFWETVYASAMTQIKGRGERTYRKFLKGMKLSNVFGKCFRRTAFREVRENIFGDSVQFMISGGGYLSEDAMKFMNGIGYHLVNGYGMTELGITSVELSERARIRNLCSVGKPFTSVEYRIDEGGELCVRGKSISHKIYENGEMRLVGESEFTPTHDLFHRHKGRYYIDGRKDDLIIGANGENFNPELLEPQIRVNGVKRVCLIGAESVGKLVLIAELGRGTEADDIQRIKTAIEARLCELNLSAATERVAFTFTPLIEADDFKVNRKRTARRMKAGELFIVDPTRAQEEVEEQDRELLSRILALFASALNRREEIAPDANFFTELGGSSLDYFSLLSSVQDEFNVCVRADAGIVTAREMLFFVKRNGDL